jgi:hypothetical protein
MHIQLPGGKGVFVTWMPSLHESENDFAHSWVLEVQYTAGESSEAVLGVFKITYRGELIHLGFCKES